MTEGTLEERLYALEKGLVRMDRRLDQVLERLGRAAKEREGLSRDVHALLRGEEILMTALDLTPRATPGDRGILEDMDDTILRLEDYLLGMGDRVQRILGMLQTHKELLDRVGETVIGKGERDRVRLELDIAMNSISILSLAGVEVDPAIASEMETLRKSVSEGEEELAHIKERKEELVKRLEGEIKKYDLGQLYAKRLDLPGYR